MIIIRIFIVLSLSLLALYRTDGFSPSIIAKTFGSFHENPIDSKVAEILSKPFHYLGKGRQCFVFESDDRKWVVKFFNQTYLDMPWYSFINEKKEREKRSLRRHFFQTSYAIAKEEFQEGILFLHLNSSSTLSSLQIQDRASRVFQIDLNHVAFVLQERGEPIYPNMSSIFEKEGILGLKREIDQFLALVDDRISKCIADADTDIEHNWGYLNGELFHLDPGRLYFDPTLEDLSRQKEERLKSTRKLEKWLASKYPEAAQYLRDQIQGLL